jgi:RNA polymerase sigma factor (sigma-70 family)
MSSPELPHLRVDELIELYAHHRERRDLERMRAVWEALVVTTVDRIRQLVKVFHFPGGERLPADRVDDAIQEAYLLVLSKVEKFRGSSEGEFRAILAKWVWNACMDYGRGELRHDQRVAGSLDELVSDEEGGDRYRYANALEAEARRREADRLEKEHTETELAGERDLLAWGIAQVENDDHRAVLEMTYLEGLTSEEIASRLDISLENVYQRRRRGKKRLEEILREGRP